MQQYIEFDADHWQRKLRKTDFHEINELTIKWFRRVRSNELRINGPLVQAAALDYA